MPRIDTLEHLQGLCEAKRINFEKRGRNIELTTPCGGTTAVCESVAEALDTVRHDAAFRSLPIKLGKPKHSPSKADEVAILDQVIDLFGENSYIGESLADQRDSIVRDIASDFLPIQFRALRKEDERVRADLRTFRAELEELQAKKNAVRAELSALTAAKEKVTKTLEEIKSRVEYAINSWK